MSRCFLRVKKGIPCEQRISISGHSLAVISPCCPHRRWLKLPRACSDILCLFAPCCWFSLPEQKLLSVIDCRNSKNALRFVGLDFDILAVALLHADMIELQVCKEVNCMNGDHSLRMYRCFCLFAPSALTIIRSNATKQQLSISDSPSGTAHLNATTLASI